MNNDIKLSKVQQAIKDVIESFIDKQDGLIECNRDSKYSACHGLMYCFHNNKSINTDGDLYDILLDQADFNYGHDLYTDIHNTATKYGYYLEYEGQGVYNIEKV